VRKSSRFIDLSGSYGAGSVLAMLVLVVSLGLLSASSIISAQLLEKARLESKSDTIALAAADSLRGLSKGFPCTVASELALKTNIVLKRCRIVGFEVFIEVSSNQLGILHEARSRAGPSS
jgi:secretion/DNA translocation related TadE-like protein